MHRILTLWVALLLLAPAAAAAAEGGAQEYMAAVQTFEALKAEAAKNHDMPRLSDPRVRETLDVLSNRRRSFGSASFPTDDGPALMDLCSAAVKVTMDYQLFAFQAFVEEKGLRSPDPKAIDAAMQELVARNVVRFQDEMFPLIDFSQHCIAAELPWLTAFMEKLPPEQMTEVRRDGLRKMRASFKEMVIGNIKQLSCEGVREDNRRLAFDAVARDLPVFSAVLPVAERAQLRDAVETLRGSAPEGYQPAIGAMMETLSDARCEGLCRL
jgi:hypothetical protein